MTQKRCILLKYGELILKGLNKRFFEDKLLESVREKLSGLGDFKVSVLQSTVTVFCEDDSLYDIALERMQRVFGIVSVCIAYMAQKDPEDIQRVVREYVAPTLKDYKSFKCDARRSDKKFPMTSPEISKMCGAVCLEVNPRLKVDVRNPEITVMTEIRDNFAFVHAGSLKGAGGMPVATSGKVMLLLSGGIDSPVAGHLLAKRGAQLEAVHFESYPYTSLQAKEKVLDLARIMANYTGNIKVHVVNVTNIQLAIKEKCREEYFTLILRRFMMRIADYLAKFYNCGALVTGESLGQVASQTLSALHSTNVVATIPVFRPLIGTDKEEIVTIARRIGTFDTSVLPFEDCCTVFTPRHPKLNVELEKLIEQEEKLDIEALIKESLDSRDTAVCKPMDQ